MVIDPALDAYTGDPNNLAAVREFVSALGAEAAARSCGVLLVAHSRKAARGKDSDPRLRRREGGRTGAVRLGWPGHALTDNRLSVSSPPLTGDTSRLRIEVNPPEER